MAELRLLVLLATFCSLRWGELAALTRASVDVEEGFIHVRATLVELADGSLVVGPPKTAAGRRVVAFPPALADDTLIAQSGAALADLMARMGHAITRAALIYIHTSSKRDRAVAAALDEMLTSEASGT